MRLLVLALPLLAASARPADACAPPQCWPGAFVPRDGATIPENAPGFYFRPSLSGPPGDASLVRLTAGSDPTTSLGLTAVPQANGDYVLVPDAPLVEGETYTLEDGTVCGDNNTLRSTFTAGPAAALPSSLGTVQLIGQDFAELELSTLSGSCSKTVDATVALILLAESASASPWKDLLLYETLVDDKPWVNQTALNVRTRPGESWAGRGMDVLYRICGPNPDSAYKGLDEGTHQVRFRATLPGPTLTASLATPAAPVDITCVADPGEQEDPDTVDDDGGCSTGGPTTFGFMLVVLGMLVASRRHSGKR